MKKVLFSENLKKKRQEAGYTQEYMAYRLNVSSAAYSRWEIGVREPSLDMVVTIADVLEIRAGELLERESSREGKQMVRS